MNAGVQTILYLVGCSAAALGTTILTGAYLRRCDDQRRRRKTKLRLGAEKTKENQRGVWGVLSSYLMNLSVRIHFHATRPLFTFAICATPRQRERNHVWFVQHVKKAGLEDAVSEHAFLEARFRLAITGVCAGALLGVVLSNELGILLGLLGLFLGWCAPKGVIRSCRNRRTTEVEQHLSQMLEVVALGLRSGLSFDRSFDLYGSHFKSILASSCSSARKEWLLGRSTRDVALRNLAESYDSDELARVIEHMVRALRFGSPLAEALEVAAAEARAEHRAHLEERAAKAPIKMMMPTGIFILPAMLLLVLGPVLLQAGQGFA